MESLGGGQRLRRKGKVTTEHDREQVKRDGGKMRIGSGANR